MQPLGEAVDEQIDHLELGQIGLANASYSAHSRCVISLTAVPLNGDRPRSSANSASISRVDSPRASSSSLRAADDLVKPGAKGHRAITDLRRSVFDHALRRLQPARAVAVAIAGARGRATHVILASQCVRGFALRPSSTISRPQGAPARSVNRPFPPWPSINCTTTFFPAILGLHLNPPPSVLKTL